jgi:hypothetical protein
MGGDFVYCFAGVELAQKNQEPGSSWMLNDRITDKIRE